MRIFLARNSNFSFFKLFSFLSKEESFMSPGEKKNKNKIEGINTKRSRVSV